MKTSALATLFVAAACSIAAPAASPPLVVHEWGTFTSFQDEQGRTIPGINVDDEPVPFFVHRLAVDIFQGGSLPASWSQGAPRCHPDVTMRLETPVLYFYPPDGWESAPFDVRATFNGGWLTEFYPSAAADGVNFPKALDANERGSLQWRQVRLDPAAGALMPETSENVWLAPRKVASAVVVESNAKEAEKYLFYRGVGHLDPPLVVRRTRDTIKISLRDGETELASLPRLWIVEVGMDGHVRHRTLNPTGRTVETAAFIGDAGATASSLPALRGELSQALTSAGLYEDEAAAMLETWRLSYFESEGLRVFFVLPQTWTEAHLPLSISTSADITRLMVGRVELVTDWQRARLDELMALPDADIPKLPLYYEDHAVLKLMREGAYSHAALYRSTGRDVPKSLGLYNSLGRFRDALLAHELQASDGARRARLERVMRSFSACIPESPVKDESRSASAK